MSASTAHEKQRNNKVYPPRAWRLLHVASYLRPSSCCMPWRPSVTPASPGPAVADCTTTTALGRRQHAPLHLGLHPTPVSRTGLARCAPRQSWIVTSTGWPADAAPVGVSQPGARCVAHYVERCPLPGRCHVHWLDAAVPQHAAQCWPEVTADPGSGTNIET